MSLSKLIRAGSQGIVTGSLPEFWNLERSVDRVQTRWPDAVCEPDERDRDRLCREMHDRLQRWDWDGVPLMRITSTAVAAFDDIRRNDRELQPLRDFLVRETAATKSAAFRTAMLSVYLGSFDPNAPHTLALSEALQSNRAIEGARARALLSNLPSLLDCQVAHLDVAKLMIGLDAPYEKLKSIGIRSPHAPGLMQHAHLAFVDWMKPELDKMEGAEKLLGWLSPNGCDTLQSGARKALEALLSPWVERTPDKEFQSLLTEAIIDGYGDPRLNSGGVWAGFDLKLKDVMLRWLTQASMEYFCDVVTATQSSHMWAPRRDFWLDLFHQGRIDAAWVALGSAAHRYAIENLLRQGESNPEMRFGRQHDRGSSTSLLIMKFGNRIVVDGCHSYKTHIFVEGEQAAPTLYQRNYNCDRIMRSSQRSRSHSSLHTWRAWVEQNI